MSKENVYDLNKEQQIFIRQKVQKLGSVNAVKSIYSHDCSVDKYALYIADQLFNQTCNTLNTKKLNDSLVTTVKVPSAKTPQKCKTAPKNKEVVSPLESLQVAINNKRIGETITHTPGQDKQKVKIIINRLPREKEKKERKSQKAVPKNKPSQIPSLPKIKTDVPDEKFDVYEKPKMDPEERERRRLNAEAFNRMMEDKAIRERNNHGTSIPEFEEGEPRSEFGTRDEYKRMRARDWGDMQKRHRE